MDCGFFSPLSTGPNTTNGTNYMFGMQCNIPAGHLQIWNGGAGGGWVNAMYSGGIIPCSVSANTTRATSLARSGL
jgi:hypothetical protein